MLSLERKLCAGCGQPNLNSETSCWACGCASFAPPGSKVAGERTIYLGDTGEQTLSWSWSRPNLPVWAYPAAAGVLAVTTLIGGFCIGRATGSARRPQPPAGIPQASGPIALPTPNPPSSIVYNSGYGPGGTYLPPDDPPVVTVRSKPLLVPQAGARPGTPAGTGAPAPPAAVLQPVPPGFASGPLVYTPRTPSGPFAPPRVVQPPARTMGSPQIAPQVGPSKSPSPSRQAVRTAEPDAPPGPSKTTALVAMRNDSPNTVEVALDGNGSRTARISPGGVVPLNLPPGSYQLRASGPGLSGAQSTLALAPQKTYTLLVVTRRGDDGKEGLVLIEPAIDGQ